ncbi:MAG: phosphoglycerate dehydrogenase [gamma proteobacterium symbiont of Bathyaustriella thionipta]|nr:phosphoglycerate dehydrogenase [gamma proteobacterium symbiont of Bathyaustriella thionipta]MCU7949240.1 phosphoglycerate dehydrogenase [gamma proteobacterium symbiont of Bathyaustriella thionipta]MCU7954800.1 phosphoglycerate dehydrogenase [gamma proteobacterium symbiont of Bathyaustriella thionipta]MCU7955818.1 phosphoglycerate dehydrogenase [gamma proteobacterium symbiont of Bathyaustriella thionipta]MCU7967247.1 phosphoglycerate dehydrogenase [gamma proteobacterium symbiont of Bathyaustr
MNKILTLNNISVAGLEKFPRESYEIASEIQHPDGILLRSFKMHDMAIPESLKAVGRAGTGVNNIPVDKMSAKGIPVFNAPGANANAVKELVLAGMLMSARHIGPAWEFAKGQEGTDEEISKAVEAGKKNFGGFELPGKTLGVVGLGAIGRAVAKVAEDLGMNVIGFDPGLTVESAWMISSSVEQAASFDAMLPKIDFLTFHVPLIDVTRNMLNADRIKLLNKNATILNFARGGIIDDEAMAEALKSGHVYGYVNDFANNTLKDVPNVVTLPHLGASTQDAEDNCAIIVSENVREYLENGNIKLSVNFPEVNMPKAEGCHRITIANSNVPNMLGQISSLLADANLNISDMVNKSKGNLAYTIVDVNGTVSSDIVDTLDAIDGVLCVRVLS